MSNLHKGFISPLLLALIALLLIGGGTYVYVQNKQGNQPIAVSWTSQATSTPTTEGCERTAHFSLGHAPFGWSSNIRCLRGTAIFTTASSPDYTTESPTDVSNCADSGGEDCSPVLVKGARFEVSADPGYPYAGCDFPAELVNNPSTEKKSISVDGYEGVFAYRQQPANSRRSAIDYYYVRVPISGAPCQMIDFVSVVSTTTDYGAGFQKFLENLDFQSAIQATPTTQTITEESTTTATFTGYYAQKQVREIYDGEDFGVKNCDTFIAYKSNDPLFQFLSNWSPGTVDINGNLSLNITLSNVSSDVKNKILMSTKEQPILLTIQKKVFPGKGLPVCGSVVNVISVK